MAENIKLCLWTQSKTSSTETTLAFTDIKHVVRALVKLLISMVQTATAVCCIHYEYLSTYLMYKVQINESLFTVFYNALVSADLCDASNDCYPGTCVGNGNYQCTSGFTGDNYLTSKHE